MVVDELQLEELDVDVLVKKVDFDVNTVVANQLVTRSVNEVVLLVEKVQEDVESN